MSFSPIRIELRTPLKHGHEDVTSLLIEREMVSGDLRGISVQDLKHDDVIAIASRLTNIPPSVLNQLKMPDYLDLSAVIVGFFGDSLPTGQTP